MPNCGQESGNPPPYLPLRAAARTLVFNSVPQQCFGTASGVLNLGGSMGLVTAVTAVIAFIAFFATRLDHHTARLLAEGLTETATPAHVAAFRETFRLGALIALLGTAASTLARRTPRSAAHLPPRPTTN